MKKTSRFLSHLAVLSFVSIVSILVMASSSQAALDCKGCHAVPPVDSATRDLNAGSFQGNHQTHMPVVQGATATTNDCAKCHGSTAAYSSSHSVGSQINIGSSLNSGTAGSAHGYFVGGTLTTFKNQTSIPILGTCQNVNCHFNAVTDTWGTAAYSAIDTAKCSKCHSLTPGAATNAHPSGSGSGKKHGDYYGTTTTSCANCHEDHTAKAAPFQHATSALHTPIGVKFITGVNTGGAGVYSGGANLTYPNYLSSPSNGNCTSLYCHSDGTTVPGTVQNTPVAWNGAAGSLGCNGCHKASGATGAIATSALATGAHNTHVASDKYGYSCAKCHSATVAANGTIITPLGGKHVDKSVNVSFNNSSAAVGGTYGGAAASSPSFTANTVGATSKGLCNNVYCHSDGTRISGTFTKMSTAKWDGSLRTAGAAYCASCHGGDSTQPALRQMATGSHVKHIAGGSDVNGKRYTLGCIECHSSTVSSNTVVSNVANHANYKIDVAGASAGTYSNNNHKPAAGNGNCTTSYCHSNGAGAYPATNALWGTASTGACSTCHVASNAVTWTGSATHVKHIGTAANYQYACATCHIRAVAATATAATQPAISSVKLHINGSHNVDFNTAKTVNAGSYALGTTQKCTNIYCHSDGTKLTGTFTVMSTARWGSPNTAACNSCHGNPPSYTTGVKATNANSHTQHSTFTCNNCHYSTTTTGTTITTAANHVNQVYNLQADPTVSFTPVVGTPTVASTCSTISCHGNNAVAVAWGANNSLNCQDCHGNGGTTTVYSYGANFWADGVITAKINMTGTGGWSTSGHGRPTASGNYPQTNNVPANFTVANSCEYCHENNTLVQHKITTNPFRLKNQADATWGKNGVCQSCHAIGSAGVTIGGQLRNSISKVGSYHHGSKHLTAGAGGGFCWDCHNGHGSSNNNHAMIRENLAKVNDGVYGIPQTTAPVTFVKTSQAGAAADYSGTLTSLCNACHASTTGHYNSVVANVDNHNNTSSCVSCHTHTNTASITDGFAGGDCNACHGYPPVPRNMSKVKGVDFAKQNVYSSAKFEDYSGGGGMHIIAAHVSPTANKSGAFANCTQCHNLGAAGHSVGDGLPRNNVNKVSVVVNPKNTRFNASFAITYSGAKLLNGGTNKTGSCYNVNCHFKPSPKWSSER